MRLIDADELIRTYEKETGYTWSAKGILECPKCFIDNAPTVEPCYQTTSCLDCKMYDKEKHNCPRFCEVIRSAIEERPQGDLINRKALKKAYFNAINETSIGEVSIIDLIDNAPTVEPEITDDDLKACMAESHHLGYELAEIKFKRPQGKWIKNEGRDLRDCFYTCSKCGRNINVICGETLADYPFCHCGADMRGDKE